MDISEEELRRYSPSQLLEYTLKLRQDVRKNGYLYSYPYSKSWFDLPFEMREMVIDEMDVKTRCKFTRCSKVCETEAKRSRNFLYSIEVGIMDVLFIYLDRKRDHYYILMFEEFDELKTTVSYKVHIFNRIKRETIVKWTNIEEGTPNDVMKKYLNNFLETYRNSIKKFVFGDDELGASKGVSIKHLKYLKEVDVEGVPDSLESLIAFGFTDYQQLLRIQTLYICLKRNVFLEELFKFKGKILSIVTFSEDYEEMNKFLIRCKNGEIHDNVECIDFCIDNESTHDKIIQGLDVFKSELDKHVISFLDKHVISFRYASSTKKSGIINVSYSKYNFKVEFKKV